MNQDIRPRDAGGGTLLFKADAAGCGNDGVNRSQTLAGSCFFSSPPFNRTDGEVYRGERLAVYRTQFQNEQRRELLKIWRLFEKFLKLL